MFHKGKYEESYHSIHEPRRQMVSNSRYIQAKINPSMDNNSSKFHRKIKFPYEAKALIYAKRRACSNYIVGRSLQEKPKIIQVKYQENVT
jgi:hypothetical protein